MAFQLGTLVAFHQVLGQQWIEAHEVDKALDLGPVRTLLDDDSQTLGVAVQPGQRRLDVSRVFRVGRDSLLEPLDVDDAGFRVGDWSGCQW